MTRNAMRGLVALELGLAAGIATFPASAAPPTYTATPLNMLGEGSSFGYAINARGEVTGSIGLGPGIAHAFLHSGGKMIDLGTLGGSLYSLGIGINDRGQVTGDSNGHAFLYSDGKMIDLGTLGGTVSGAGGINAGGQVTGSSLILGDAAEHAFLYSGGMMYDLGTLGGLDSGGVAINDSGQVTGFARTGVYTPPETNPSSHAFLYGGGPLSDLGTLGGNSSIGTAINRAGQVVGSSETGTGLEMHAFLYSAGAMIDIGGFQASAINASGQITGTTFHGTSLPFLYDDGIMYDVNTLVVSGLAGATLINAPGINDSGQIVANSCPPFGVCQAYRLDPVASEDRRGGGGGCGITTRGVPPDPTLPLLTLLALIALIARSRGSWGAH